MTSSINRMITEIAQILNQNVYGIWLYGSVVLNDFRLGWSDIDFIAITNNPITDTQAERLVMLRQTLSNAFPENPYYPVFEGAILNLQEYFANNYTKLVYWGSRNQKIADRYDLDTFSKYEIAKYGSLVLGTGDRNIFLPPSREELLSAVQNHYVTIRKHAVQTNESIYSCGWLLDIARCIYTLRHHDIIGKTQAAIWALNEHIFPDEASLKKTLEIRQHPMKYKHRDDIKVWLGGLGATVQRYADVLESELHIYRSYEK